MQSLPRGKGVNAYRRYGKLFAVQGNTGDETVKIGDTIKIKTARDDDTRRNRHSGVAYKCGRIVYMNRQNGWVCMDFGYYRACAYIRDIRNNVVIVV